MTTAENRSALSNLRVLDLSRVLAGPWASQILADLGAEVIKVESPQGDDTRQWGPPYLQDDAGFETRESAYFLSANRGKKSICLDFNQEEDRAHLKRLIESSDVLIENFKTGSLQKYGFDYASVSAINPGLVYCSITGFGQTGPYREKPGYDFLLQAMGGLMSITGAPDSEGGEPMKIGVALSDVMTGLYATIGILAALSERNSSGLGQQVDLALLDVTVASLANQATNYLVGDIVPTRLGNSHPNVVPYQSFATKDGHCIVAVGNERQFESFCAALELPGLTRDERFSSNENRVANRDALISTIEPIMRTRTRDDWLAVFSENGVPAGPINNIDDVFEDPQIEAREMKITLQHPNRESLDLVGSPIKLSRTPVTYPSAPPLLGEHTEEILNKK